MWIVSRGNYSMRKKWVRASTAACYVVLFSFSTPAFQVSAAESLQSGSSVTNTSQISQDATESTQKAGTNSVQLSGGVAVFQPHSLLGLWNGHIKRLGRHPKLQIDYCQDGQIAGSYKGIFGTFPVTGQYDEATGNISIHVDFSRSRLTRLKRLRSGHGVIEANIQNGILIGHASIPDLGPKTLRWEAVKDSKDIVPGSHHL